MPITLDFANVRLPTALAFGSEFGPEYATDVVTLLEGAEQRNSRWGQDRPRGDLRYAVRSVAYLQQLLAFVHARRGEAQAWRFKWHLDWQGAQQFVGIGDDATTQYQLIKIYDSGPQEYQYVRKITRPVGIGHPLGNTYDSVALYQDGVWMPSGYTVDYTTGNIALDSPLGAGVTLTATYEFDWPMRFASATFLTSLQAILTRAAAASPIAPGPPQYFTLRDSLGASWYYWLDTRGEITRDAFPPLAPFVDLALGVGLSWLGVSDETSAQWYLFPDTLGQLSIDAVQPAGSGINYNVPLPTPLAGLQVRGEDGQTLYTIAADSAGEPYIYHDVIEPDIPDFDAYGQTESIPIVGVK